MFATLKLGNKQAFNQLLDRAALLCPVEKTVRLQGIGAQRYFLEGVGYAIRLAGAAYGLEQGIDPFPAAKFIFQKGQVRLAFWWRVRIEEKG